MRLPCSQPALASARLPSVAANRRHRVALAQVVAWRLCAAGRCGYNLAGTADRATVARGRAIPSH